MSEKTIAEILLIISEKDTIQEQESKDVFEYDIYNCPEKLKGQLKIGDFNV